ncbi:MAG: class I SAM-dependent methyltransferase [Candidatus Nanopelagicales bacterium]
MTSRTDPAAAGARPGPTAEHRHQAAHWEGVHAGKAGDDVSWWQPQEGVWSDLWSDLPLAADDPVIDVGAGSSTVVECLLDAGCSDVTVLDLSASALHRMRERLGPRAEHVHEIVGDVRHLHGDGRYRLWHDRAVLHFLTDPADVDLYRESLLSALAPGGYAVVAAFAPDGPETCSGLPVHRYDADALLAVLGPQFALVRADRRLHVTPWRAEQPFTVVVARRRDVD